MSETFSGPGILITDGAEHACAYRLDVYMDRRMKTGSGTVVATPDALWAAFEATRCEVRMDDGRTFPLIVTNYAFGSDDAPFKLAGAIRDAEAG